VTSIEINPKHRDVALENTAAYKDQVDIILGSALDVMPKLAKEGKKFDFVFIDASWEHQYEFFRLAIALTREGGCIYVDNVVRELFEHHDFDKQETLLTKVGSETKVQATLMSTVSSHKGKVGEMVDGFLLAIVKGN
jgi:predicted O-methyltransferase YrrM